MESKASTQSTPVALTIAGSDSGANAGIQADLKTFGANGIYGTSAITCITAQNPIGLTSIHPVPPECVRSQIDQIVTFYQPRSVKTGMLYSSAIIDTVSTCLARLKTNFTIVVDPVMISTSGKALIDKTAVQVLQSHLLPLADLITPNLDEAEALLGNRVRSLAEIESAAHVLAETYESAVLVKGGHLKGNDLVDTLCLPNGKLVTYPQKRVSGINTHGSGCTLSAAIAAWMSKNYSIEKSVSKGLNFMRKAMGNPVTLNGQRFINHYP